MAKRIKKEYPKLPIIISGDALYACEPVITKCRENKWEYILRLKEERLKLLGEEVKCLERAEKQEEIKYWNNLKYGEVRIEKEANVIKYYEKKKEKTTEFMWITSFEITEKNKKEIVYYGRQRWKIENEGFNMQKNGTFDIEHIYSMNYNEGPLFLHTICTYDKAITRKGFEIHKRIKNKHKRSKCNHNTSTYSKHNKSNWT